MITALMCYDKETKWTLLSNEGTMIMERHDEQTATALTKSAFQQKIAVLNIGNMARPVYRSQGTTDGIMFQCHVLSGIQLDPDSI